MSNCFKCTFTLCLFDITHYCYIYTVQHLFEVQNIENILKHC